MTFGGDLEKTADDALKHLFVYNDLNEMLVFTTTFSVLHIGSAKGTFGPRDSVQAVTRRSYDVITAAGGSREREAFDHRIDFSSLGRAFFLLPDRAGGTPRTLITSVERLADRWEVQILSGIGNKALLTLSPGFELQSAVPVP